MAQAGATPPFALFNIVRYIPLDGQGIGFRSLTESVDPTIAAGTNAQDFWPLKLTLDAKLC